MSRVVVPWVLVLVSLSSFALAGCLDDAAANRRAGAGNGADLGTDDGADATVVYRWEGSTPVHVFVCNPLTGCPGHIVAETDWIDDLPHGDAITGVDLTLEWQAVNETIGPMVFRLNRMNADGTFRENLANLENAASPIHLAQDDIVLVEGEFLRVTVWPAAKDSAAGQVHVYIDVAEQPFVVSGPLTLRA